MLEDFLEKNTVPLFVYVIDGKMRLRPSVSLTSCILNVTSHRYRKDTCISIEECPDSRMTLRKKALKKYELLTASNFVRAYSFCRLQCSYNVSNTLTVPSLIQLFVTVLAVILKTR